MSASSALLTFFVIAENDCAEPIAIFREGRVDVSTSLVDVTIVAASLAAAAILAAIAWHMSTRP